MKKKIILTAAAIVAVLCICALPLLREVFLPAVPVEYRAIDVPSVEYSSAPFIDDYPSLLSDAEDAATLAETIYSLRYTKYGESRRIPCAVTYDQQQGVYAVELIDAKYAAAVRKGEPINLLGGIYTIYLNEKDGAVLAVEIQD